jgi:membrane protein
MLRYLRVRILPTKPAQLLLKAGQKWHQDDCGNMAAALSFHALFSLFPILLVILGIVGSVAGPDTGAFQSLKAIGERYLPENVHALIASTLNALHLNSFGTGVLGFGFLLYAASSVFTVLSQSVDKIWHARRDQPPVQSFQQLVGRFLRQRLWSMVWVLGTVILLGLSLLSGIMIRLIVRWVAVVPQINRFQTAQWLQVLISWVLLSFVVSLLFKALPATRIYWRDVVGSGLLTATLWVGLQQLVSNSVIALGGRYLFYGVIGNVMVLLLWIYFTCQIFLAGCELAYVYTHMYGSRRPSHPEPLVRGNRQG